MTMRQLLTAGELSQALNGKLSPWSINDLRRRSLIPFIQISPRKILYDLEAVNLWLDNLQKQPGQPEQESGQGIHRVI